MNSTTLCSAKVVPVLAAIIAAALGGCASLQSTSDEAAKPSSGEKHYLYVATPGIRDYLEYGGHSLLVFYITHGERFLKRIRRGRPRRNREPPDLKRTSSTPAAPRPLMC